MEVFYSNRQLSLQTPPGLTLKTGGETEPKPLGLRLPLSLNISLISSPANVKLPPFKACRSESRVGAVDYRWRETFTLGQIDSSSQMEHFGDTGAQRFWP